MDIEQRSIEYIPEAERYGSARRLFTIWFSNNMNLPSAVVGTLGIVFGMNFIWTVIAIVAGSFIGQIFTSAHSAQGPHLGIPQMIQSRAQFGVLGAILPLIAVCISYTLTTSAFEVIGSGPLRSVLPVSGTVAIIAIAVVTAVICFIGYELIHRIAFVMTAVSTILFLAAAILLFQYQLPANAFDLSSGVELPVFLLMVTQVVSVSLSFGPYVADYSRYLPSDTPTGTTYAHTFGGNFIGAVLSMSFGAALASMVAGATDDAGTATASLFGGFKTVIYLVLLATVVQFNVLNVYSNYMSVVSIFTGFNQKRAVGKGWKLTTIIAASAISALIAVLAQDNFFGFFSNFLTGQLYLLVPWSAINLTDFYLVRKGRYSVKDIYDPRGIYGRYNGAGIAAYLIAIVAQLPFMGFSFYHGAIYNLIGADIAWVVGLVVPAIAYYLLMKGRVEQPGDLDARAGYTS